MEGMGTVHIKRLFQRPLRPVQHYLDLENCGDTKL